MFSFAIIFQISSFPERVQQPRADMKLAELSELMSSERKGSQLRVAEYEDYIATLKDELDSVKSKSKLNNSFDTKIVEQIYCFYQD